jgi:DNA mismatch repair protein MutS
LSETQHDKLGHITNLSRIEEDRYVWLDRFTIRNLELTYSLNENATTLIDIIDETKTPMGGRMMKRWMVLPLKELSLVQDRVDSVDHFVKNRDLVVRNCSTLKRYWRFGAFDFKGCDWES